jgi:multidrug efflux pump subunit AcrA (membrane-fusion protein)
VAIVIGGVATLSIYYLVRGQPLLVQGEVDATRFDIAARVDGRVAEVPVVRGQNVEASAVLVRIDNPETLAKHEQAVAAKIVADAQLANINAGTRPEVIAARKAALERAKAAAKGKDVRLGGGVATVRQYVQARLVDELHFAVRPVLLGAGEHLFHGLDWRALGYECTKYVGGERAAHIVLRRQP